MYDFFRYMFYLALTEENIYISLIIIILIFLACLLDFCAEIKDKKSDNIKKIINFYFIFFLKWVFIFLFFIFSAFAFIKKEETYLEYCELEPSEKICDGYLKNREKIKKIKVSFLFFPPKEFIDGLELMPYMSYKQTADMQKYILKYNKNIKKEKEKIRNQKQKELRDMPIKEYDN